jgi:hypothetical protein
VNLPDRKKRRDFSEEVVRAMITGSAIRAAHLLAWTDTLSTAVAVHDSVGCWRRLSLSNSIIAVANEAMMSEWRRGRNWMIVRCECRWQGCRCGMPPLTAFVTEMAEPAAFAGQQCAVRAVQIGAGVAAEVEPNGSSSDGRAPASWSPGPPLKAMPRLASRGILFFEPIPIVYRAITTASRRRRAPCQPSVRLRNDPVPWCSSA